MAMCRRAWVWGSATTISTAASTCSRRTSRTTPASCTATTARVISTMQPWRAGWAWRRDTWGGAGIVDLDNDGLPDLFVATGGVFPEVAAKLPAYPMHTLPVIFRSLGNGRFEELLDHGLKPHCS